MPFFPENSTSQSQMCVSFIFYVTFCPKSWTSVPLETVTSYLSPPMGNWVLSYFPKDTNDICVSYGSLLLSHPFTVAYWDGGNWADNLQLPHLPTSWNCHLKPPSPQAAISQLLSTAGPVELGFYSSTQDFPDRESFHQPTLRATLQSETPPTQTSFLPLVTGVTSTSWSEDFLSYSFCFLSPLSYNTNELRSIW